MLWIVSAPLNGGEQGDRASERRVISTGREIVRKAVNSKSLAISAFFCIDRDADLIDHPEDSAVHGIPEMLRETFESTPSHGQILLIAMHTIGLGKRQENSCVEDQALVGQ